MQRVRLLSLVILALALGACGDEESAGSKSPQGTGTSETGQVRNSTATYTEDDVIEALDLQVDEDYDGTPERAATPEDLSSVTPDGCEVAVIMTSEQEVETYADAGDAVATNPAGNAGVKFSDKPGCGDKLAEGLKALD